MYKKAVVWVLVFFCSVLFSGVGAEAFAAPAVSVTAPSVVLYDLNSDRIVYSKDPYRVRAPASTTKVMTAIVVLEHLNMDRIVTIPQFAHTVSPSKIHLRAGERYRVRDLVRAALISSANDATEVLGYVAGGGSLSQFSKMMNAKARAIGCKKSNFVRPSGLPDSNHYSTAYDMALIMKYAERNYPFIVQTLKEKSRTIRSLGGRKITLRNHNKMLWRESREVVGKTGWTRAARHCFLGHFGVNSRKVLISILGSQSLWKDLRKLLDFQFGSSYSKVRTNQRLWARHEVKKIQTALRRAGFSPGPVDGQFGPATLKAVEGFQKAKGLSADGIVGPKTWDRLRRYL
ncbi:MAG: peptidoglycan-binding protein [Candidatus Omnitrophota bacterium]